MLWMLNVFIFSMTEFELASDNDNSSYADNSSFMTMIVGMK